MGHVLCFWQLLHRIFCLQEVLASFLVKVARQARTGEDFRDMAGDYWASNSQLHMRCPVQPIPGSRLTASCLQKVLASFLAKLACQARIRGLQGHGRRLLGTLACWRCR